MRDKWRIINKFPARVDECPRQSAGKEEALNRGKPPVNREYKHVNTLTSGRIPESKTSRIHGDIVLITRQLFPESVTKESYLNNNDMS